MPKPKSNPKTLTFQQALEKTPRLSGSWRAGLQALRAEDRPHIRAEDPRRLRGSSDIDTAYQPAQPNSNRWDFAIGYKHTNREDEVIYWVETHTASDSEISVVIRKADWLLNWLKADGHLLAKFEKDIYWVASGRTKFTPSATKLKQLALMGVKFAGSTLNIRNNR